MILYQFTRILHVFQVSAGVSGLANGVLAEVHGGMRYVRANATPSPVPPVKVDEDVQESPQEGKRQRSAQKQPLVQVRMNQTRGVVCKLLPIPLST